MKYHLVFSLATASMLASQVSAGTMGLVTEPKNWTWIGSVSAGPVWARGGDTQTFYLTPEIEKTYAAKKSTYDLASGELFVGIQKSLSSQWLGQLGLAVATTGNAHLQGVIWDDADPQFDNFTYRYKIQHTQVAVKGKLLFDKNSWLTPWIGGSLGIGFNNARAYHSVPTIFEAVPTPDFSSHTQTAFTYTVGSGVQKALNEHWQAGVGYEFANWGKNHLGRAREQTLNEGLALNRLYTNGILFNLTFIA